MFIRKHLSLLLVLISAAFLLFVIPPAVLVNFRGTASPLLLSPLSVCYQLYLVSANLIRVPLRYRELLQLRQEVANLRVRCTRAEEQAAENVRLRELLELRKKTALNFIAAEVIGKDPSNWLSTVIINKGEQDGISVNQPVMQGGGVIGKVTEAHRHHAKVLLISDANSRVVALVQRTRVEGIMEGIGGGLCRLKFLPPDTEVQLGDTIITAGVGGVYPEGLLLGNVESIRVERGGAYKNCIIRPIARLAMLEEVACLKFDSTP